MSFLIVGLWICLSLEESLLGMVFCGEKDGMENLPVFRGITAAILRGCFFFYIT